MTVVLGIDSSTQSTKALLIDAESGQVLGQGRAPHPEGTEVDPRAWLDAVDRASHGLIGRAQAVSVGGQQHGMVALDASSLPVRDALLWNDTRSAQAARDLIAELGGPEIAADRTGSVHVASITSTKLRWMRDAEPQNASRTERVVLPHDWVSHHLNAGQGWFTDRGDASGTGYFSPSNDEWDTELAVQALGHDFARPSIATHPNQVIGETAGGALIAPGTGDNMAAALGLGLAPGDVSVSIGTSGVCAMVSEVCPKDPTGTVTGFADATGRFLPMTTTLNSARILDFARQLLAVNFDELSELALASVPGANGLTLLPYFDGERTPNRPHARATLHGLSTSSTREDVARACIEGLLCSLADGLAALTSRTGGTPHRIFLIGGGARSAAVQQLAPAIFGRPVTVAPPGEYVALGAARQAAWALTGQQAPPNWDLHGARTIMADPTPEVLESFQLLKERTSDWA